jgi:hypothetical protein
LSKQLREVMSLKFFSTLTYKFAGARLPAG